MDATQAKAVLEALLVGADPETGEVLAKDAVVNSVLVRNALLAATHALESETRRDERARQLPGHAGRPWASDEDERLSQSFLRGASLDELTKSHQRTRGAIKSRLQRLGLLVEGASVLPSTAVPEPAPSTAGDRASASATTDSALPPSAALVKKRGYELHVSGTHVFSAEELQVLHRYGFWLEALAEGRIEPTTAAQEQFCLVVRGEAKPQTLHERAWMRLVGRREIEPELKREFEVSDPGEEWFKREAHWRYQ